MAKRAKAPLAACLACVLALMALAYLAYAVGPSERLDARLLGKLAAHGHTALGSLAEGLAYLADPLPLLFLLAAACAVALLRGRPRDAVAAVVVVAGANVTTQVLKVLLAHPRYQPSLGAFQVSHPKLAVRLETTGRIVDLARENIDVAIRSGSGRR